MKSMPKKHMALAIIGLILLSPAMLEFMTFYVSFLWGGSAVLDADPAEKGNLVGKLVGVTITSQLYSLLILAPGLVVCSLAIFYFKVSIDWFGRLLKIVSILMLLTFPITSFAGAYLFFTANKVKQNA